MKAEIVTTGTELLLGEIADTNTPFLAGQLAMLGIDLYYTSTVGDNYERLLGVLRQAWQRADMVIMTGGLGPTRGDITREVIAGMLGEKLELNADLKQDLTDFFARAGMEMPQNNLRQATLIPSARALRNRRGTAPGWWVERDGRTIVALPGPPHEMQAMWQNEVLPRLERKAGAMILSRTIKVLGLGEARVDELVSPFLSGANPTLGIYARPDGIHLRITAKAAQKETAGKLIAQREAEIRAILNEYVWGVDNDSLEGVVGQLLKEKGLTLAVAESFTGGLLACTLAGAPQSGAWFRGGIITASEDTKDLLAIEPRAAEASVETAAGMARWARSRFAVDIAIGLDGYASSDAEPNTGKAFIVVDRGQGGETLAQTFTARSQQMVRRTIYQAMFKLRNVLLSR